MVFPSILRYVLFFATAILLMVGCNEEIATELKVVFSFFGILIGIVGVLELIINNPNQWLGLKISLYAINFVFFYIGIRTNDILENKEVVLFIISITAVFLTCAYGAVYEFPKEHISDEIVGRIDIVALNDAYEVSGKSTGGLLSRTFIIGENGVYRYYYKTDSGLKKQGYIDSNNVYIDDNLPNDVQPYIEKYKSYDILYSYYNKELLEYNRVNEQEYYIIHVPYGSIVESYELDLK